MTTKINHDHSGNQNTEKQRLTTALHEKRKAAACNTIRVTANSPTLEIHMTINRNLKPMDHFQEVETLLSAMTQQAVADTLNLRQATVSEMATILEQCGLKFGLSCHKTVPLSKLFGFARVLRCNSDDKDIGCTAAMQVVAKKHLAAALAAMEEGIFTPDKESLCKFQPPKPWYKSMKLYDLCAYPQFRALIGKAYRPPENFASAKEWLDAMIAK